MGWVKGDLVHDSEDADKAVTVANLFRPRPAEKEMMPDKVILRCDGNGVGRLILNQPARRNALSQEMWQLVPTRLAEAAADPAIRVLVVQGAGGTFAAGADISEFEAAYATRESTAIYAGDIARAMDGLADFIKPTVALIQGACVGGGLGLALACDLRFAASDARMGITPGKLGLVYPLGDTKRLVQLVGPSHAKDLLYTGRLLNADEALSMGLVNRVTAPDAVEAAVLDHAAQITAASQYSARATKRMIARVLAGQTVDSDETVAEFLDAVEGEDFIEGRNAFRDKRKPGFTFG